MEDLFDEEKHLDQPVLATPPLGKLVVEVELTCVRMYKRVMDIRAEEDLWHGFWILLWEDYLEFQDCILVYALLTEISSYHSR